MATGWGTNELVGRRPAANAYEQARRGSAAGLASTLSSRGLGVNAEGGLGLTYSDPRVLLSPAASPAASLDRGGSGATPIERGGGLSPVSERLNAPLGASTTPPAAPSVPPGQVVPPGTPNTPGGPTAPPAAASAIANTLANNGQTVTPAAPVAPAPFVPVTSTINTDNGSYQSQTTPAGGNTVWNPNGGGQYYVPAGGYNITGGGDPSQNGPTAGAPFGTDNYGNPFTSQAQADDWRARDAARSAALGGYTFNDAYRNAGRLA